MSLASNFGTGVTGSNKTSPPKTRTGPAASLSPPKSSPLSSSTHSDTKRPSKRGQKHEKDHFDANVLSSSSASLSGPVLEHRPPLPNYGSSTSIALSDTTDITASTNTEMSATSFFSNSDTLYDPILPHSLASTSSNSITHVSGKTYNRETPSDRPVKQASVPTRVAGKRPVTAHKVYARSITSANLGRPFAEAQEKALMVMRSSTSSSELSPRPSSTEPSLKPSVPNYSTALDTLLASIDTLPVTRERSQSEPFSNSWSYHSASPIIPITDPLLKRDGPRRSKVIRQVSQLFQNTPFRMSSNAVLGAPTSQVPEAERSKKRREKSSERPPEREKEKKRSASGLVESSSRETLDVPSSVLMGSSSSSRSKDKQSKSKSKKSSRRTSERSKQGTEEKTSPRSRHLTSSSSSTPPAASTPIMLSGLGSSSPNANSPGTSPSGSPYSSSLMVSPYASPRNQSSLGPGTPKSADNSDSISDQGSESLSDSCEHLPQSPSSTSSASASMPPLRASSIKELTVSPRVKSARTLSSNTTVEFYLDDVRPITSARSKSIIPSNKDASPSRSRAKSSSESLYYTDTEGTKARKRPKHRSGGSHIDEVFIPSSKLISSDARRNRKLADSTDGSSMITLAKEAVSTRLPKTTPNPMWLVNKVSDDNASMFFGHLQEHLKDTQLCEAIIMMHTEIVSSRFLLDNLLSLYASISTTSAWGSPPSSYSSNPTLGSPLDAFSRSQSDTEAEYKKAHSSGSLAARTAKAANILPSSPDHTTVKTSIINFLKKWVRLNTQDFTDDTVLQEMVRDFVNDLKRRPGIECQMGGLIWDLFESSLHKLDDDPNTLPLSNQDTLLILGKYVEEERDSPRGSTVSPRMKNLKPTKTPSSVALSLPPDAVIPQHLYKFTEFPLPILGNEAVLALSSSASIGVLDISPHELARQWCLLDHSAFAKVRFRDFLRFASKPEVCPSLDALSSSFNHGTSWVAYQIFRIDNPKKRARMVGHMIALAEELLALNNFHSFLAVIIGLTQLSVGRLRATWKQVSKKELKTIQALQQLASPLYNFAALRNVHDSTSPPFVPLPALFLRDLVMLTEMSHEGFIDPSTSQVNVEKILMIDKLLGRLHSAQRNHYKFVPIKSVQQVLQQGVALTSEELEAWSARIEPGRDL